MTAATTSSSRVKDLVVTAGVASVVSAVLAPWVRRLVGVDPVPSVPAQPTTASAPAPDDFNARLERLLEVPEPFPQRAVDAASQRPLERRTSMTESTGASSSDDLAGRHRTDESQ